MPATSSSSTQSETRWYYAVDDAHVGPVSSSRFWQLADEGVIRSDTLVWCTGFANWVPASTVEGLFKQKPGVTNSGHSQPVATPQLAPTPMTPPESGNAESDSALFMQIAKSGILLGLLCVVFTRGCDAVDSANVDRISATRTISEQAFEKRWAAELQPLKATQAELAAIASPSSDDKRRLQEAEQQLRSSELLKASEQTNMERETWGPLRFEESHAASEYQRAQMFRNISVLLGTTLSLLGLGVALFFAPPEQQLGVWIALSVLIAAAFLGF